MAFLSVSNLEPRTSLPIPLTPRPQPSAFEILNLAKDFLKCRGEKISCRQIKDVLLELEELVKAHAHGQYRLAAVRLRTAAAMRFKKIANAPALIWRVLLVAERSFRKLDHLQLLAEVAEGAKSTVSTYAQ